MKEVGYRTLEWVTGVRQLQRVSIVWGTVTGALKQRSNRSDAACVRLWSEPGHPESTRHRGDGTASHSIHTSFPSISPFLSPFFSPTRDGNGDDAPRADLGFPDAQGSD